MAWGFEVGRVFQSKCNNYEREKSFPEEVVVGTWAGAALAHCYSYLEAWSLNEWAPGIDRKSIRKQKDLFHLSQR